jgi:hypothetical protein
MVSQVSLFFYNYCIIINKSTRCTVCFSDPNGESERRTGGRRTRDLTDLLVTELELGVLWDKYGLVGDVEVN